jgi:hypothetical protein
MDITPLEPDAGAMKRAQEAVAAFNRHRPDAGTQAKRSTSRYFIPYVAACSGLAIAVIAIPALHAIPAPLLAAAAIGAVFGGRKLFGELYQFTDLQRATYKTIVPALFSFIDGMEYAQGRTPGFFAEMPVDSLLAYDNVIHGDWLRGSYQGLEFELGEAKFQWKDEDNETHLLWHGVMAHSRMTALFDGLLTVTARTNSVERFISGALGISRLPLISSGNNWVDETFDVQSSERLGISERALRAGLGTAILWLRDNWAGGQPLIAVTGRDVYVLLPTDGPQFGVAQNKEVLSFDTDVAPVAHRLLTILPVLKMVRHAVEAELDARQKLSS